MPAMRAHIGKGRDPAAVERLLRALPDWFGIEEAIVSYVADAARMDCWLARGGADDAADVVGALLAVRHFPVAAEVHLMAVAPSWRRRGVGRALLDAVEAELVADGVRLLQVKTLSPSRPNEAYAQTRAFYARMGFLPLEELPELWGPANPCLVMVKAL
jgi:ribosomal protein S18 acetylase RimI-like enzyme